MLLRWLKHGTADGERRAIAAAASLCLFLWTLKVHLVWWMWWSKGVHVLADVPAATVPLLGAHDLLLCAGLAVIYALVAMLARPLPRGLGQAIAYGVPALIGCAVALFAVISWKVQQLYGCAVEMDHFRAATGISAMRDSIVAYLTAGTIAFLIMAVLTPTLGAYLLARVRWSPPRWRTWFVLLGGSVALYGADKSLMKERYTHGVEQDAVLHFVQWYEPAPRPVDVAEMLRDTPAQVPSRDAEFRRFTPFAPMPQQLGASDQTPTTAGLPLVAPQPT
ncbi:MAG TPA: hypothetical protein VLI90_06930, partial [Tepidisphaeraceae bacterium]|nr:hypothetical protein [Tepidisphaeraceae bacterium]